MALRKIQRKAGKRLSHTYLPTYLPIDLPTYLQDIFQSRLVKKNVAAAVRHKTENNGGFGEIPSIFLFFFSPSRSVEESITFWRSPVGLCLLPRLLFIAVG